jgi:multidrug efflux pump subunit AcrA (membrane-fusion protein)
VPVGTRSALLVPEAALVTRSGLDFVRVMAGETEVERVVVPGETVKRGDEIFVEILTGLAAGDSVILP